MRTWKRVEPGLYTWSGRGHVCYIRQVEGLYIKRKMWEVEFGESITTKFPEVAKIPATQFTTAANAKTFFEEVMKDKTVQVRSLMNQDGPLVTIAWDTPHYMDPSCETYWSM